MQSQHSLLNPLAVASGPADYSGLLPDLDVPLMPFCRLESGGSGFARNSLISSGGTAISLPSRQMYAGKPSRAFSSSASRTASRRAISARTFKGRFRTLPGMLFGLSILLHCKSVGLRLYYTNFTVLLLGNRSRLQT